MKTVLIIAGVYALVSWLIFGGYYDRFRWWKSTTGRNVMTLTTALNALIASLLIFLTTPYEDWATIFGTVALIGIGIAGNWRTVELYQVQHDHIKEEDTESTTKEEGSDGN